MKSNSEKLIYWPDLQRGDKRNSSAKQFNSVTFTYPHC